MKSLRTLSITLPVGAMAAAIWLTVPTHRAHGYELLGGELDQTQRDFRVHNNFTDPDANGNQTPDPNFPGYQGAVMAIWKGCVEWQSRLHGDGNGDPTQVGGLGSGGANFDPTFQGERSGGPGGLNANVHSQISGCDGGVLAFTETPIEDGWRIRYYECWDWNDGPGNVGLDFDLQGVAAHEYGHALGLSHSSVQAATMFPSISPASLGERSIHADDMAGVQAIYGLETNGKPRIEAISIAGGVMEITGKRFSDTNNQVWFTEAATNGNGAPVKVTGLTSNGNHITVTIPSAAGPGDVLVRKNGTENRHLSNAWPSDLQDDPVCSDPQNYCIAAPNSTGAGMTISWLGSTSVSQQDFFFFASSGPPQVNGIFFYGPEQLQNPFGDGFLCVGAGSQGTFRLPIVSTDVAGDVVMEADWSSPPIGSGPGRWNAGDVWNAQFWYRDPAAGGAGFNLTDGLEITLCP